VQPGLDAQEGGSEVDVEDEEDADGVLIVGACDGAEGLLPGLT
jgi:hypothetical protein